MLTVVILEQAATLSGFTVAYRKKGQGTELVFSCAGILAKSYTAY